MEIPLSSAAEILALPSLANLETCESHVFCPMDQSPGQSGLTVDGDRVVWKCLIIGCGTANSLNEPICASCRCSRPSAEMVRRARLHQEMQAKEKQAALEKCRQQLEDEVRRQFEHDLQMKGAAMLDMREELLELQANANDELKSRVTAVLHLLAQVHLLNIAQSGNAQVLQALDALEHLEFVAHVNRVHPFQPLGPDTVSAHRPPACACDSDAVVQFNMTALMIASCLGHSAVVRVLLKVPGINRDYQDEVSSTLCACV